MSAFVVTLQGGAPWGLRLQGGSGTGEPLRIAKINPGSKASRAQLHVGDVVETVNGVRTANLPVNQAQKLLHNNSNDLQLRIHRNQLSVNGSYHPNGKMSSQSSLIVTNDSGFSGTDDRRLVRKPSQDDVIHLDGVTLQGFDPGSVSVVRTTTTKVTKTTRSRSPSPVTVRRLSSDSSPRLGRSGSTPGRIRMRVVPSGHDSESEPGEVILPTFATGVTCSSPTRKGSPTSPPMSPTNGFPMSPSEQKGAPPPPVVDIPNNNNNLRKDEDEFWPPPPPPDESIWSPSKDGPSVDRVADQMAPPPPPAKEDDGGIAPVWTPGGVPAVKKEFKPVKLDLNRPKTSTVKQPTYSSSSTPAAHTWNPPNKGPTSPKPVTPQSPYAQPMAVDTLPDPSHILSPSYVSPRSPIQQPHPPPPPQFAGDGPVSPHPPASSPGGRPVPASPAGAVPYQSGGLPQYEGMANGYGFIPASAVMSGSPGAFQSGLLTFATPSGPALPSTNDNSTIILDPANLPPGALFQKQTIDGDVVHTDTFYPVQGVTRKTSTVTKHDKPNYEGIGPRDKDGLPLGLRQHVKEDNRHDWYKEMFKSIHKQDRDDDGSDEFSPSQYLEDDSSDSVFMSESEVMHAQDDWKTVDRDNEPEKVVKNKPSYRVQPGRITDFVPGKSALAAHEKSLQSRKDGPLYDGSRRGSAPGSGYASDEEARKAYHSFIKSGELPSTAGFGFGAPPARREPKTSTAGPIQPSLQQPSYQEPPPTSTSSISSPSALSPALHGGVPSSAGSAAGVVPTTTLTRSASLPRSTGLPKRRQRYSEGSGLSAAERLGIKTPPPARLSASATTKPVMQDSRYDYLTQFPSTERQISEKKPRQVREPDASYNKSLPEYLPIKSPSISDDRFDDFDFTPPVTVPAAKQELTRASAIALYPFTAQSKKELSFKKGDTIYLTREIDKNWLEGEHHGNKGIFPRTYVEIVTSLEEARNLQVNTPSSEGKGRAKYRFKGETANELSVNKGEIVDLIRKIDANWWEVRHGNKAGIVPVAYLDVLREPQQGLSSPQPRLPMPKSPLSPGAGRGPLSPSQQAPRSPPVNRRDNYQPSSPYQTDMPSQGRQQPSQQNRAGQGPRAGSGSGSGRGVQQAGGRPAQNAGFHPKRPDGERYRAVYSYQPSNDDELEIMEGETVVVMEKCDDGWYVGFSESTGQFGTFPGNYVEKL